MSPRTRLALGLLLVASVAIGPNASSRENSARAGSIKQNGGETVVAVAAGEEHSCAVLKSGSIKCWGDNSSGQLGDGTTEERLTPVEVKGIQNAIAVSAGSGYTCALLSSHRMSCWGANGYGELGDGTQNDSPLPVAVAGIENVRAMSTASTGPRPGAFPSTTCALLGDGTIRCWGASDEGALGDLSPANYKRGYSLSPVTVAGITNAVAISDTDSNARCAVLKTGEVACWGGASYDESNPSSIDELKPALVDDVTGVTAVVGDCALISDGTVSCWDEDKPETIKGISSATAIASTADQTCALVSGGKVECWAAYSHSRSKEAQGLEGAISLDGDGDDDYEDSHFCAVVSDGGVECWGYDDYGELGDGYVATRPSPAPVVGIDDATSISAGATHACAGRAATAAGDSTSSGLLQVACWGANQFGQLGDGKAKHEFSTVIEASPIPVLARQMTNAATVAVGWWHACALVGKLADNPQPFKGGGVRCWGAGKRGQLGLGRYLNIEDKGWRISRFPRWAKGLTSAVAVSAGGNASCALLSSGEVDCWGGWVAAAPTAITGVTGATAIDIAQNGTYMCAIVAGGQVECWYYEPPETTEQGTGSGELASPPSTIEDISGAVAVDATSACAVVAGGKVECWSPHGKRAPAFVTGIEDAVQLNDNCAVLSDGGVSCWEKGSLKARRLESITGAVAFSAGGFTADEWLPGEGTVFECVLEKSGAIECWDDDINGELGSGGLSQRNPPVRVIGLP